MEIKFDVYFKKNLGTLFKSNEADLDGIPAHTNLDLKSVDRLEANYKVGTQKYTDNVGMVDIEERVIQIPFKSDVVKVGLNEFEIVAYMLNGDIKTSQTYTYHITEAIGRGNLPGSGDIGPTGEHLHINLAILDTITQAKIDNWNNKADKEHIHNNYADKEHIHSANEIEGLDNIDLSNYYTKTETDKFINNKADKVHKHSEYLTEHQDISHKADKVNTYTKAETDSKIFQEIEKIELKEGPQGPQGEQGPKGDKGDTANIEHLEIAMSDIIERLNKLEENTDTPAAPGVETEIAEIVTENSFVAIKNTVNSCFEDVKLEGKTLVNLCNNTGDFSFECSNTYTDYSIVKKDDKCLEVSFGSIPNVWNYIRTPFLNHDMLKTNTVYTVIFEKIQGIREIKISNDQSTQNFSEFYSVVNNIVKIETKADFPNDARDIFLYCTPAHNENAVVGRYVLLEGDYTQSPPPYFKGLMSVGDDANGKIKDVIVSSTDNLQALSDFSVGYLADASGQLNSTNSSFMSYDFFISVEANTSYWFKNSVEKVYFYDENKSYIGHDGQNEVPLITFTTPTNCLYIKYRYKQSMGDYPKINYIIGGKYHSDKKILLYYNDETQTWEKPILRQWDSIEKHEDGKYYYHVRSEEVSYSAGDENNINCITDKTKIVKKLSTEKVYECTDLSLKTYTDETNYIVESGVIIPKSTLKVPVVKNTNTRSAFKLSDEVLLLQNKVSILENLVNKLIYNK